MLLEIELPDEPIAKAERFASRRNLSRSALLERALRSYMSEVKRVEREEIIARINRLCEEVDTSLPPALVRVARETLRRSEWDPEAEG